MEPLEEVDNNSCLTLFMLDIEFPQTIKCESQIRKSPFTDIFLVLLQMRENLLLMSVSCINNNVVVSTPRVCYFVVTMKKVSRFQKTS